MKADASTKADAIRHVADTLSKPVRPRDVIAALAEQGTDMSRGQVSQVLRGMGQRRRGRGRRKLAAHGTAGRARSSSASPMLSLESLIAAKNLADQVGGIEAAKQAVEALAKLS